MKAALKKKWIAALRSGKYTQGKSLLRQELESGGELFCCLGVLAHIEGKRWRKDEMGVYHIGQHDDLLPPRFATECNLGAPDDESALQCKLARMNDDGYSFDELATYIDENL